MNRFFYTAIITIFFVHPVWAQKSYSGCLEALRTYIENTASFDKPSNPDLACLLDLEIINTANQKVPPNIPVRSRIKILTAQNYYSYETDEVKIYSDYKELIQIIIPNRQIIRSKFSNQSNFEQDNKSLMSQMQVAALKEATVLECNDLPDQKRTIIRLKPNAEVSAKLKIKEITYHMDMGKTHLYEVLINYQTDQLLRQQRVIYHQVELKYPFSKPRKLSDLIFLNGNLLPKYKGFQVLDNRF